MLASCKSPPAPTKESPPPPSTASAAAVAPATLPTLAAEPFAGGQDSRSIFSAVEGALIVSAGQRVGRIDGDKIEWVGNIPKGNAAFGDNVLSDVYGRWPDELGAVYVSGNGRAPQPTYYPLTGKGVTQMVGEGGGLARIDGVARVGATTLIATLSMSDNTRIFTVRGPKLTPHLTTEKEAGCKPGEVWNPMQSEHAAAIPPRAFEASPAGTLVSLGQLCDKRGAVAEVWDKGTGKPRIVPLDRWWKKLEYAQLLRGSGDELFASTSAFQPVLRIRGAEVEAIPDLERPISDLFTSNKGQLFAYDGRRILRLEEGRWTPVARFAAPGPFSTMAVADDGTFWIGEPGWEGHEGHIWRLKQNGEGPIDDPCTTHFVHLYKVSSDNAKDFTFPTTRAALAKFPEAAQIGLVELGQGQFDRRLGFIVTSREQGQALVAHVKATMKDEDPRLTCLDPKPVRKIPLDGK